MTVADTIRAISSFRWKGQMVGYWALYLSQGAFLGSFGPALQEMSSKRDSVADYNPAFALHGIAAIISAGFFGDVFIQKCMKSSLGRTSLHLLLGTLAFLLAVWYFCMPFVNQYGGHQWVTFYMVIKGFLIAISNVVINKCVAWTVSDNPQVKRRVVNSLNGAFACGTILGPLIAIAVRWTKLQLVYLYGALAAIALVGSILIYATECPQPSGEEAASLLRNEDDLISVPPTLPSPISGGVFLHVSKDLGTATINPDSYNPTSNFIVLLVMLIATLYTGIQVGLAAFLFQYVESVMPLSVGYATHAACCIIMFLFWGALAVSYALFTRYLFTKLQPLHFFLLAVLCVLSVVSMFYCQDYYGPENGIYALTISIVCYATFISPLFTGSVQTLIEFVSDDLLARVSSLLVFGCFCGESFVPVLMGFFMGSYSGSAFGPSAIVYITFVMTVMLMLVSGLLMYMGNKRIAEKIREQKLTEK
ncbi:transmembrane protein [Thraustotheca clavata]|uniref:Transmembrane protein n=1 Tax=Thraustotheca clavata TaxID=74557 RepID=A0A1V9ZW33_9STRA|nr:transmembrane protein [Thraustotheca clavata]